MTPDEIKKAYQDLGTAAAAQNPAVAQQVQTLFTKFGKEVADYKYDDVSVLHRKHHEALRGIAGLNQATMTALTQHQVTEATRFEEYRLENFRKEEAARAWFSRNQYTFKPDAPPPQPESTVKPGTYFWQPTSRLREAMGPIVKYDPILNFIMGNDNHGEKYEVKERDAKGNLSISFDYKKDSHINQFIRDMQTESKGKSPYRVNVQLNHIEDDISAQRAARELIFKGALGGMEFDTHVGLGSSNSAKMRSFSAHAGALWGSSAAPPTYIPARSEEEIDAMRAAGKKLQEIDPVAFAHLNQRGGKTGTVCDVTVKGFSLNAEEVALKDQLVARKEKYQRWLLEDLGLKPKAASVEIEPKQKAAIELQPAEQAQVEIKPRTPGR